MFVIVIKLLKMEKYMNIQEVNSINSNPVVSEQAVTFKRTEGSAQYAGSSFLTAVRVERGISLEEAKAIAANDPEIDYFFYAIGNMILPVDQGNAPEADPLGLVRQGWIQHEDGRLEYTYFRSFEPGDALFFKNGHKWLAH